MICPRGSRSTLAATAGILSLEYHSYQPPLFPNQKIIRAAISMQIAAQVFPVSRFAGWRYGRTTLLHHDLDGFDEGRFFILRLLPPVCVKFLNELGRTHLQGHDDRLQITALHQ